MSKNLLATVLEDDSLTVEILPMGFAHKVGVSDPLALAESSNRLSFRSVVNCNTGPFALPLGKPAFD